MKKNLGLLLMIILLLCFATATAEEGITLTKSYKKNNENNPLYTQRFGADPGVMVYDGRVYVFMTDDLIETDQEGKVIENTYSKIRCINLISSDDLVNWTDHGRIPVAGKDGIAKWATYSWAPCAAHKTIDGKEKFFLYFCNGGNGIGVLTADSPTGPWRDERGGALVTRQTKYCFNVTWLFDPAVMVDEDGTGYLAFGGGVPEGKTAAPGTGRIVKLGDDMISLDGDPQMLDVPYLFEDSGINKINGKYVYTYCSNWNTQGNQLKITNGAIEYMVAEDPMGPYTYVGELFPNEGVFFGMYGNNHHSIAELNGRLFLFYHNRPVEKAMGITGNYRSPQLNEIFVQEDGTFKKVIGTMKGVEQLKHQDPYTKISACTMSNQAGIDCDGTRVTDIDTGDWIKISGVDFGTGCTNLRLVGKADGRMMINVVLDDLKNEPIAKGVFASITKESRVKAPIEGVHDVYFVFEGQGTFESWQAFREGTDIDEAIRQETNANYVDQVPSKYLKLCEKGGTIEKITYTTQDYFGDGSEYTKNAFVYLPPEYDPNGAYDLLILCHGIGGSEFEWGMTGEDSKVKRIMDNLTEAGVIRPFVIVTPNGRAGRSSDHNTFYKFGQEIRNDLIPFMEEHYAVVKGDREHRAMAGLSMGGMQTVNIGMGECLDLFSRFGAFSACPTTNPAAVTAAKLKTQGQPVNLFYSICGTDDSIALASARAAVNNITGLSEALNDDNFVLQELPGGHDFGIWYLGFYNFARMIAEIQ